MRIRPVLISTALIGVTRVCRMIFLIPDFAVSFTAAGKRTSHADRCRSKKTRNDFPKIHFISTSEVITFYFKITNAVLKVRSCILFVKTRILYKVFPATLAYSRKMRDNI